MRKLIIQIPCYNEAEALPITLRDLPREVIGFDTVEWLVVDDGSEDNTIEVARQCGVDHVVRLPHNIGLARAFMTGIEACLKLGADTIVNTDADNQYVAACIPDLVKPILDGRALIVVGARPISSIADFSAAKRLLQKVGSWVVRFLSSTTIEDAPSGFRAIHREAATRLYVYSRYTYTLETIIQAGRQGTPIISVPIKVNGFMRPSRLVRSIRSYVWRSIVTILRIFVLYKPLRFFATLGTLFFVPGILLGLRFLVAYLNNEGDGHVQSLILASILLIAGGVLWIAGIISDLVAANRVLLEEIRFRLMKLGMRPERQHPGEQ